MDKYDLQRFVDAQANSYTQVLRELRAGKKRSHWMWFIFPQFDGLGFSATAHHYAIKNLDEARAYLQHPVLGARLVECTQCVNDLDGLTAHQIFGSPDDLKFGSSMTLFELVAEPHSAFATAMGKYYSGQRDARTLQLVRNTGD